MSTTYKELRSSYDLAFRQFACELQHVNELQTVADTASNSLVTAREKLAVAQCCYLQARNALASYLLSRQSEPRLTNSTPEAASRLWESGSTSSHLHQGVPGPC